MNEARIISRKAAAEKELKFYFTGIPCAQKHIAQRVTDTGACRECKRINDKRYYSTYHRKSKCRRNEPRICPEKQAQLDPRARFIAGRCDSGSL